MKLLKFRVFKFRSVQESGWIETDTVTSLIGVNESGKTNLLIPLWKLNPAKDGGIDPISDYPRKQYHEIRALENKPNFIEAVFELSDELAASVALLCKLPTEQVNQVFVARDFNDLLHIDFQNASPVRTVSKDWVLTLIRKTDSEINKMEIVEEEEDLKVEIQTTIKNVITQIEADQDELNVEVLQSTKNIFDEVDLSVATARSIVSPRFSSLIDDIDKKIQQLSVPHPNYIDEIQTLVEEKLPKFVYYSNYGNLDSEIYLPHVIANLERKDLGSKEEAKARTLKVLFDFVRLKPKEILELGKDFDETKKGRKINDQDIKEIAEKKKEREILLTSASASLTEKFRSWWKQGNYRFRFQADGDHFRIWVSDDKRPEEIELENRSTGLQWFLSFYLIFLVESLGVHKESVLLLDEPGLSLHPIAQKDLALFFEGLSSNNQIIYTTHSPFLVDPNHLDRVKAVYVDTGGATRVSSDLRSKEVNPDQNHSIYPVHAALGLSVSNILLQNCLSVVVEGPSDQFYLSAIKNYLISNKLITPQREIVFIPSKGTRGISAVVSILTGKDDALPFVLLDSDAEGRQTAKQLREGLYSASPQQVLLVSDITGVENAEIEDLFPVDFLATTISKYLPRQEEDFDEVVEKEKIILPQLDAYIKKYGIVLPAGPGYKVEIAKLAKSRLIKQSGKVDEIIVNNWIKLFTIFS
jgi:predicted ATP-dependent endonuclease of OLD family